MSPWIRWRIMKKAAFELTRKANVLGTNADGPKWVELGFSADGYEYHMRITRKEA